MPPAHALVLDASAGTGRDAAWLARRGYDAPAVELSGAIRAEGEHRRASAGIRWTVDRLPALGAVHRLGLAFDFILLGGVWRHVGPGERESPMRKLLGLLRPDGVLALTLGHGPAEVDREMHPVSRADGEHLARGDGALVARIVEMRDHFGRPDACSTG